MLQDGDDKKPGVEDLLGLLERGQNLLEQAQQTLAHARRVHAEVTAKAPPPPAPPPPAQRGTDMVMFPWPPPEQMPDDSGGEGCRA